MKKGARAKPVVRWEAYSPAPHILGRFTTLTRDEDGLVEESRVEARCLHCSAPFRRTCSSGRPTDHIDRFAAVHARCDAEPRTRAKMLRGLHSTAQTESEKAAILAMQPMFQHGTQHFREFAKVDAPDIGPETLTPQRCRELLTIIVRELGPLYGVSAERLMWLAGLRLSLVSTDRKTWIPVAKYLDGSW